jgi:GNAT superfamily N-acetyltransferase
MTTTFCKKVISMTAAERMPEKAAPVQLRNYRSEDIHAFTALNRAWLGQYFVVEPIDEAMFNDPQGVIIEPGGDIYVAELDGEVVGVCALIPNKAKPHLYEFAKMGIDPARQGHGIGRKLAEYVLKQAKAKGAQELCLYSSRILIPALKLYQSLGFREVPMTDEEKSKYARGDIKLMLGTKLKQSSF